MSGEPTHPLDAQGSALDSQAASRPKRNRSPEQEEPTKRHQQDPNASVPSQFEVAKELFRQAGEQQLHAKLGGLMRAKASSREQEAAYSQFFEELAFAIVGRKDIPVPPAESYATHIRVSCDPEQADMAESSMNGLLDYIMKENKKRPRGETHKPAPEILQSVQNAWKTDYVGNNDHLLKHAIGDMYKHGSKKPYGNFLAIIQGSGTGKSRVVDRLSRTVFTIPIILRPNDDKTGFPLGDFAKNKPLVMFFTDFSLESALYVQRRYLLFLLKVISFANQWIDKCIDELEKSKGKRSKGKKAPKDRAELLASQWYEYIGGSRSDVRQKMYTAAISESPLEWANDILDKDVPFDAIQKKVWSFIDSVSRKIKPTGTESEPAILFYFDEAHHLTKTTVTAGVPERTAYQCLCKAFTYMVETPVFALFLSTYSRLSEFAPSARNFWSSRPQSSQSQESDDNLNAPFVELPFDAWKNPVLVTEGSHSVTEICSLKFMARFGRPLFWALLEHSESTDALLEHSKSRDEAHAMLYAMEKLRLHLENPDPGKLHDYPLQELIPLLAARIDLTFESNRDEAVFLEGLLVASSMRTVYSVPQHRQYLRGGYPSEPFLAEAAARVMYGICRKQVLGDRSTPPPTKEEMGKIIDIYKDKTPSAVSSWFTQGLIDKGNRGELVARMLCTLAHDIAILKKGEKIGDSLSFSQMIPVVDFLRALIAEAHIGTVLNARPSNMKGKTLEEAFKGAFVHFTQFVKAGDKSTITDEGIYLLFLRGGAIQGYWSLDKADIVIPVYLPCKDNPDRWCMSAIFIQVKNRVGKQFILIDAQKTFEFFTTPTDEDHSKRPYITIAMELGVLLSEQKKAVQPKVEPKSKTKSKAGPLPKVPKRKSGPPVARSKTPERKPGPPTEALSPANVRVLDRKHTQTLRRRETHPRYEIFITGCSNRVYNVVGTISYSSLLAHKDMLAEHPRKGVDYHNAIIQMKPYWKADLSYGWAEMKMGSRLGARTIKRKDVGDANVQELDFDNKSTVDDFEDQPENVIVNEYGKYAVDADMDADMDTD